MSFRTCCRTEGDGRCRSRDVRPWLAVDFWMMKSRIVNLCLAHRENYESLNSGISLQEVSEDDATVFEVMAR